MKIKLDAAEDIVACVDCKHYVRNIGMWLMREDPRCSHGYQPTVDLVTGKISPMYIGTLEKCRIVRKDDYSRNCGPAGKYWQPRKHNPANTFRLLKRTSNEN